MDTPIWSLALRRRQADLSPLEQSVTDQLSDLIVHGRAQLLGVVRQELLSGLREPRQFERLRIYLRSFPDATLSLEDYEDAARASNQCRSAGIVGSPTDMLICAVGLRRGWPIFTADQDFIHYRRVLGIRLLVAA